ncbi:hypothetical protein [Zavarzinia compransoris]|uniref:Uncharacterized protein n=1 Tax=Zavarzinia compransoris TaxID=1264899 RepID=A0A317E6Q8_9PROT|nr:hypothetical protein [Zavarzinia compransoris]PWR20745.1 hypothetical protein DKG75_12175 [Zavarzinia compransoris]TDP44422.1 hypothetical protein DES42_107189 [Zavarzinia compransoris]
MDRLAAAEIRLAAALDRLDALPFGGGVDQTVHATLVDEYDRLNRDVDELSQALEDVRTDNRQLENRIAELAAENAVLRETPAAAAPDLERRLADAEAFADEALSELDTARKEMAQLRQALAQAEQQSAQRQADLFRLENAQDAAAKRLDQTIGRLDRAIAE